MKGYDNMDRVIEKVFINITNRCNNQCSYCFQDNSGSKKDMPVELLEKIFLELDDIKVNKVILSGGEASLHPQFDTILSILKKYKFTIGLFTNGLLSDEVIKLINESNISSIYLSLDGTNDNYNRSRGRAKVYIIEENLRKIKKKIIIMNTLNSQNYLNVEQFIEYCNRQNKIQKINFNPIKILHNSYQNMELTKKCYVL